MTSGHALRHRLVPRTPRSPLSAFLPVLLLTLACTANSAGAADDIVYLARDGDTLIGIARTWMSAGRSWQAHQDLGRHNRLSDRDRIRAGREIRIPADWLRREAVAGTVKRVQGKVSSGGSALFAGAPLLQGAGVLTGGDGYVTLVLADGSELVIGPDTDLRVDSHRRYEKTGVFESALRLLKGAVDAVVAPVRGPGARFEINSEQAIAAVRGTELRLRVDPAVKTTRNEVLKGSVAVSGRSGAGAVLVEAGYGTVVDASQRPLAPVRLLPAPDLSTIQKLYERVLVRIRLGELAGASKYRAVLSRDPAFNPILREDVLAAPELRYADLPDGEYFVRVRGIDQSGLEGLEAVSRFALKARPEPPFLSAPANRGKLRALSAEFSWASAPDAASYRFQLAQDVRFATPVIDRSITGAERFSPEGTLPAGVYFWRVASVRADSDQGPWSDAQQFNLYPPPPDPEPPAMDRGKLRFSWATEPGQVFLFQLARDRAFANVIQAQELKEPGLELEALEPGRYYMRYRATDPDGFVGPFTSPQSFTVPEPDRPWWLPFLLLVPLL